MMDEPTNVSTMTDSKLSRLYRHIMSTIDPAEVERRKQTPHETFTTSEVLKFLESSKQG
jgi:hypothetical protein